MSVDPSTLSDGQRAYEARRAAKAGMSLDKWLATKARTRQEAARAERAANEAATRPPRKPGLIARLIERAHRPLRP